jgi:hypothetical protein
MSPAAKPRGWTAAIYRRRPTLCAGQGKEDGEDMQSRSAEA